MRNNWVARARAELTEVFEKEVGRHLVGVIVERIEERPDPWVWVKIAYKRDGGKRRVAFIDVRKDRLEDLDHRKEWLDQFLATVRHDLGETA